jgi:hypothetical protein
MHKRGLLLGYLQLHTTDCFWFPCDSHALYVREGSINAPAPKHYAESCVLNRRLDVWQKAQLRNRAHILVANSQGQLLRKTALVWPKRGTPAGQPRGLLQSATCPDWPQWAQGSAKLISSFPTRSPDRNAHCQKQRRKTGLNAGALNWNPISATDITGKRTTGALTAYKAWTGEVHCYDTPNDIHKPTI